jgi:hypothetical protein
MKRWVLTSDGTHANPFTIIGVYNLPYKLVMSFLWIVVHKLMSPVIVCKNGSMQAQSQAETKMDLPPACSSVQTFVNLDY